MATGGAGFPFPVGPEDAIVGVKVRDLGLPREALINVIVRGDEERFTDAASFAANPDLLVSAQPGTSPFYAAVYNILEGNEENPRIIKFETFERERTLTPGLLWCSPNDPRGGWLSDAQAEYAVTRLVPAVVVLST